MEKKIDIKFIRSPFGNIRIHDRRSFSATKDAQTVTKLQHTLQQKKVARKTELGAKKVAEERNLKVVDLDGQQKVEAKKPLIKLKIKLDKQEIPKYDVRKVKEIINCIDDDLLAMIVMHADAEKVMNGLRILGEG